MAALLERVQRRESVAHSCSDELVGATEASKIAGVSRRTIYDWVESGDLKPQSIVGKPQQFRREDVIKEAQRRAKPE